MINFLSFWYIAWLSFSRSNVIVLGIFEVSVTQNDKHYVFSQKPQILLHQSERRHNKKTFLVYGMILEKFHNHKHQWNIFKHLNGFSFA